MGQAYSLNAVKKPFINVEEKVDRVVGKRTKAPDGLSGTQTAIVDSIAWRKALGGVNVPRGVYRFASHQEADRWLWQMIARPTR